MQAFKHVLAPATPLTSPIRTLGMGPRHQSSRYLVTSQVWGPRSRRSQDERTPWVMLWHTLILHETQVKREKEKGLSFDCFSKIGAQGVYYFPRACYNKYHKPKTTEMYSLTVLGARSLKSECQQCCAPSKGSRAESLCACSSFWWPLMFGRTTPVSFAFFPVSLFSPFPTRTPVIGFKAHHKSLVISF